MFLKKNHYSGGYNICTVCLFISRVLHVDGRILSCTELMGFWWFRLAVVVVFGDNPLVGFS